MGIRKDTTVYFDGLDQPLEPNDQEYFTAQQAPAIAPKLGDFSDNVRMQVNNL